MSPTGCALYLRKRGAMICRAGVLGTAFFFAGCTSPPVAPRPKPSAAVLMQERFPDRAQTGRSDNGQWLVAWYVRHWQLPVDPAPLEAAMKAQDDAGYSAEEALLAILPKAGLWTHAQYASWLELRERVESGGPVVVQLPQAGDRRQSRRFAVVTAIDTNKNSVSLELANGSSQLQNIYAFQSAWQQTRQWMITACPPDRAAWNMRSPELLSLIRFYDLNGQPEEGNKRAAEALERDPQNPDLLVSLAVRDRQQGRVSEAEQLLRQALQVNGRHVRAANNLAFLLAEQGRELDESAALARRAVLLEPANPRTLDTQGFVFMQQGNWAEACPVLDRAWQRARTLPPATRAEIGIHLAHAYLKNGEPHLAVQVIELLRRENPGLLLPPELQELIKDSASQERE